MRTECWINCRRAAAHISMSTISVALSKKPGRRTSAERGQRYLAAPVFGRPEAAEAGKAVYRRRRRRTIAVARTRRLLEALGQRVFVLGDKPEMANVVKLSGNFLIATVIESLGEADRPDAKIRH